MKSLDKTNKTIKTAFDLVYFRLEKNHKYWKPEPDMAPSQLVLKSICTQVNSFSFWSIRTHDLVNSYSVGQFVLIVWSTRTHFGQLVPILVNSYSFL